MITLTDSYQELGRSETYEFSDKGQVCACLYARMAGTDTVVIKLTRIITGTSSYVGYSYASAQATLSGSLTHTWNGGASDMTYVGEHTVFEQSFSVTPGLTLSLSAIYDDTYIAARTVSGTCQVAGEPPAVPVVTQVVFDPALQTRHANVTVTWKCENADRYQVCVCRRNVPGDPTSGGVVLYETGVTEQKFTFELAGLPLAVGDDLFFMVRAYNAAGGSGNGFSEFYRLYATVWLYRGTAWVQGVPYVKVDGAWYPATLLGVRVNGEWRLAP